MHIRQADGEDESAGAEARRVSPLGIGVSETIAAVCMLYAASALIFIPKIYIAVWSAYPIQRYFLFIPVLLLIGLMVAGIICSPRTPLTFIRRKLASRSFGAVAIIFVFLCSVSAFTAYKHYLDLELPFFADSWLAWIDKTVYFGDPWQHLRAITPEWLDWLLYSLYSQIWFAYLIGGVLVAAFLDNARLRNTYMATLFAQALLLEGFIRSALNSAGPIFYDRVFGSDRFAGLIDALQVSPAGPATLRISDYLWYSYATDTTVLGTGISAMPSGHLAIVTLNALMVSAMNRAAGYLAWAYVLVTMYGSLYFGWHYSLDGLVSIAAVTSLWLTMAKLINSWGYAEAMRDG